MFDDMTTAYIKRLEEDVKYYMRECELIRERLHDVEHRNKVLEEENNMLRLEKTPIYVPYPVPATPYSPPFIYGDGTTITRNHVEDNTIPSRTYVDNKVRM